MRVTQSFRRVEKKFWKGKVGQMARHLLRRRLYSPYERFTPFMVSALFLIGCLEIASDDSTGEQESEYPHDF